MQLDKETLRKVADQWFAEEYKKQGGTVEPVTMTVEEMNLVGGGCPWIAND